MCDEIMDYWENMVTKLWEHDEIMEPYWRNYGNFLIISSFWLWSFQTLISPLKIHLRLFKYYQIKAKKISYPVVYNKQQFLNRVRQESCGNAKGVEIMRTHGSKVGIMAIITTVAIPAAVSALIAAAAAAISALLV